MIKELKKLFFFLFILFFFIICFKYYFSDRNKKNYFRSLTSIDEKILDYSKTLPFLKNDTNEIIEYIEIDNSSKKKSYFFWELIGKENEK